LKFSADGGQCEIKNDDHRRTFEECTELVLDIPPNEVMCSPDGRHMDGGREMDAEQKFECRLDEVDDNLKHTAMMSCCRAHAHSKVSKDGSSVSGRTYTRLSTDAGTSAK
jgi:hypothetical protein